MTIKLTPSIMEGFVKTFLLERFDNATEIPDFHKELWNYCCSDEKYVAIAAPRGHADRKSTRLNSSHT